MKTDSLSKFALAKSLVARTVERSPGPKTATTAANSRVFLGKAFSFEFVSKPVVFVAAIPRVDVKCSLSGFQRWLFPTLAKRCAWQILFA